MFTNEAARDAAITSPTEGMHVYLTAPTVPAALGTTRLPSGIQTIYNGSVWVCTTPVGSEILTSENSSSSSYGDLSTVGPSVTLVTGTTAKIDYSADCTIASNQSVNVSIAVSGASTIVASDNYAVQAYLVSTTGALTIGKSIIFPGLTAGTNTFKMQYKCSSGSVAIPRRFLSVGGIA